MYWFALLALYLVAQIITWVFTPLLPLFVEKRDGWLWNGSATGEGPRLKRWLWMFDTEDNSLDGDANHFGKYGHLPPYLRHTFWLYRNSLYGLKRYMGCDVRWPKDIVFDGNPAVNRNNGITGVFIARYLGSCCWQLKVVKKLRGDWGIMWNFGWQLDTLVSTGKPGSAMFQFSPRFVKIM